jgi:hypothetical protein
MPAGRETTRARARLEAETPISNDMDLINLQEQAEEYVREAKRSDPSGPNELVSSVVDAVARNYAAHIIQKQRRRAAK